MDGSDRPDHALPRAISGTPDPKRSRSFEYGTALLESFTGGEHRQLGIAELAHLIGVSRSTTHRYASTLVELGFLEQSAKRKYRLAAPALDIGMAAIQTLRMRAGAYVALEELRTEIGHTVTMGVLDETRVIYVHRLFGHRRGQYLVDMGLGVGASVPAHCTALGKTLIASLSEADRSALLAGLDLVPYGPRSMTVASELEAAIEHIKPRDVVVSDEEFAFGARSIAALVRRPPGERALAIEITVPSNTYTVNRLVRKVGPRLKRTADLISGSVSRRDGWA